MDLPTSSFEAGQRWVAPTADRELFLPPGKFTQKNERWPYRQTRQKKKELYAGFSSLASLRLRNSLKSSGGQNSRSTARAPNPERKQTLVDLQHDSSQEETFCGAD